MAVATTLSAQAQIDILREFGDKFGDSGKLRSVRADSHSFSDSVTILEDGVPIATVYSNGTTRIRMGWKPKVKEEKPVEVDPLAKLKYDHSLSNWTDVRKLIGLVNSLVDAHHTTLGRLEQAESKITELEQQLEQTDMLIQSASLHTMQI